MALFGLHQLFLPTVQTSYRLIYFYIVVAVIAAIMLGHDVHVTAQSKGVYVLDQQSLDNPPRKYCTYFNNRLAKRQPQLTNCPWFQENACCTQPEVDLIFADRPLPLNLPPECSRLFDQLMCYICSPDQHLFYNQTRQTLTVCLDFCNQIYSVCQDALWKGLPIKHWYRSGDEFCRARRYDVATHHCMNVTEIIVSSAISNHYCLSIILAMLWGLLYLL
ncbi:uncharacterized protein TRIADDRAFT_53631 [Trichoplax adhaerens]|uniref:Folate receptor-like domain-containing protein n=1 Tax=Trichoplax adhaerens TaxID=10228 RepID=B3RPR0_TRIAD|nr:hypothetical protein TRIADDRAFT_53631 [Trichoplax adhaerens]EDV27684.1 hypothetical protein TRIADDRAFT_53631 [Trichoplax adhaerens]|eukprot:XP_002109518.1 hypothetical protein TRIADDRAFT_53631 [Trichoplax adhaerens]